MKAMSLVSKDAAGRLVINPSEAHAKWAVHIIGVLNGDGSEVPAEVRNLYTEAVGLGVDAFELVKKPESECPPDLVAARQSAYDVTSRWFAAQIRIENIAARNYSDPFAKFKN
jgi:hypothetical protein